MARISRVKDKFYDLGTPNKSFLQLAKDLKVIGIKNFYFMLEVKDVSIVNIDPFATDKDGHTTLTRDQISRIMTECTRNPWYYLREIVKLPDQGGSPVNYIANRGNIAQAYCVLKNKDSWLCLPRQIGGKTWSALALQTWMYQFGTTNSQFVFVNKSGPDSKENLSRFKTIISLLPEYLRFESILDTETGKREKSKDNATRIENAITHNAIMTTSQATSYEKALSLARGLNVPIIHFDESEFTPHIRTIVINSISAYEKAHANAIRNKAATARIFTSTPGDLDTGPGKESEQLLDKCVKWTEKIYDMTDDQIDEYINSQGKDSIGVLYIEYSYKQIGYSLEWFEYISAKTGDSLTVRREILLQRLHGSSLSPFDQEILQLIVESEHKPIDEFWIMEFYRFDVYSKIDERKHYLVGVDCSTGTDGDNNAITILDPYTLEPVAEFECSYIGETKYERLLIRLIQDIIPRAVLCIERNSVGDAIIDHLLHSPIAGSLYFDKNRDLVETNMNKLESVESMLKREGKMKSYYGVWTGKDSREDMMAILARHVSEYREKFITHNIIRDLTRLIRTSSGRIEAASGFHDDSVMSYLIALYVRYHGNNLATFGIEVGATDEELNNKGIKTAEEIDPTLVNPKLIEEAKDIEIKNKVVDNYEEMLRRIMEKSQKETYKLHNSGMVENTVFDTSPDGAMDSYDDGVSLPMSIFDELNGNGIPDVFNNNQNNNGFPW